MDMTAGMKGKVHQIDLAQGAHCIDIGQNVMTVDRITDMKPFGPDQHINIRTIRKADIIKHPDRGFHTAIGNNGRKMVHLTKEGRDKPAFRTKI